MMIITHKITMDLTCCGRIPEIDAVQDDCYTRRVALELMEHGREWRIPQNAAAVITYVKADGTCGRYDTLPDGTPGWSAAKNVLALALAPQVLTAAGDVILSVQLAQGTHLVSTFRILIHVQPNLASRIPSENYINLQTGDTTDGKVDSSGWPANRYLGTDEKGNVVAKDAVEALPAVTEADEGKFLRVSGGVWAAESITFAEEVAY